MKLLWASVKKASLKQIMGMGIVFVSSLVAIGHIAKIKVLTDFGGPVPMSYPASMLFLATGIIFWRERDGLPESVDPPKLTNPNPNPKP